WVDCGSKIYSLGQQWELPRKIPKDTNLLWVPHYDIPVFFKGKLMVTVHDLFHLAMPQFAGGPHKRFYARWMFNQVAKKASVIDVISQFTRDEWLRLVGKGEKKIRVIPNGVDESWFKIKQGKNPHSGPYFLYVGNIKPHKNLEKLFDAFEQIENQVPHDLVLVGQREGFIRGDYAIQARAGSFKDRVKFTVLIPAEQLKKYFSHAECLVFPSLYEGFGLPPLEAMACGCPVAASSAASIPEVCGKAALYFDPAKSRDIGEKMLRLVREKKLRKRLIAKGKSRAKVFSWDRCAGHTSELIDRALAE